MTPKQVDVVRVRGKVVPRDFWVNAPAFSIDTQNCRKETEESQEWTVRFSATMLTPKIGGGAARRPAQLGLPPVHQIQMWFTVESGLAERQTDDWIWYRSNEMENCGSTCNWDDPERKRSRCWAKGEWIAVSSRRETKKDDAQERDRTSKPAYKTLEEVTDQSAELLRDGEEPRRNATHAGDRWTNWPGSTRFEAWWWSKVNNQ
ncbi:hypothetical protein B0H12DRAFT_1072476 [Mycena haematopus]|nr:hypothetical protein B0H12DRAFT_1072476 [Mycena haematopus]